MSDDSRDVQSKFDRPAVPLTGLPRAALPDAPTVPAVPAAPADAAPVAPASPAAAPVAVRAPAAEPDAEDDADEDEDEDELPHTLADRLRRLSPALVILTAGSIGCLVFMARAVTSHTTPVAVLMSAGVVTGLIFGADSVMSSIATYRASQNGESGRAVLLALVGGVSAVICAGAFAGTAVMVLVLNS